ncbi:unnamed protein product [Mucor hiemalis]
MQQSEIVDEEGGTLKINPVQPNISTFNILIHIATQLSDTRTSQKLYHDMISRGLQPDVYTYTTLLQSMGKMGDINGMDHMLKDIRKQGLNSTANNTVIWNVVMSGYACNGFQDRAYVMFQQMVESFIEEQKRTLYAKKKKNRRLKQIPTVDEESYRIYIDLLVHDNRREDALKALGSMDKLGMKPTVAIYNTLFASFMKPASERLFELEVEEEDVNPQTQLDLDTVKKLYKSMNDIQVKPNSETMYTLVSAFLDLGDTKSALETFVFLTKERLLTLNKDPTNIEPCQELLDKLNSVVTKSVI